MKSTVKIVFTLALVSMFGTSAMAVDTPPVSNKPTTPAAASAPKPEEKIETPKPAPATAPAAAKPETPKPVVPPAPAVVKTEAPKPAPAPAPAASKPETPRPAPAPAPAAAKPETPRPAPAPAPAAAKPETPKPVAAPVPAATKPEPPKPAPATAPAATAPKPQTPQAEAPKPAPAKPEAAKPAPATAPAAPDDDDRSYRPRWTSPLYKAVIRGEAPASSLPAWHGNHFWKASVREVVLPQLNGWTEHLYNVIAKDGEHLVNTVPRNIQHFCPNFKTLDREKRIAFWARLISVMSSYESSYNPNTSYVEPTTKVLSSGLMQISHKSSQEPLYGCKMISEDKEQGQKDLFDPKKNLACAVNIINHWIGRDGTIVEYANNDNGVADDEYWKGLARYWGVFRHKRMVKGPEAFWDEIDARFDRWQELGLQRDAILLQRLREANRKDDVWDNRDWEAQGSPGQHPSLMEDKFDEEESHPLTSILRQSNQTAFCFQKLK
ncbi:MAG: transglycosylase SLT domain-containing protein [Bdellovibrionota bacterium]